MCLVAAGAVDAYYEHGIHCWDIAAAYVIASEANAIVCDPSDGSEPLDICARRVLCAGTRELADAMRGLIEPVVYPRDA